MKWPAYSYIHTVKKREVKRRDPCSCLSEKEELSAVNGKKSEIAKLQKLRENVHSAEHKEERRGEK